RHGVMMPAAVISAVAEKTGRASAYRPRRTLQASPRLEFLETRCLMSGSHAGMARHAEWHLASRGPLVANQRMVSHTVAQRHARRMAVAESSVSKPTFSRPDLTTEYPGVTTRTANPPGPLGLPNVRYVVITETKAAHRSFATAQDLPRVPYCGIQGTISPGDPIDLYRLSIAAGAKSLDFALASDQPAATVPIQFQLFDASGNVLGGWSADGATPSPMHADL